MATKRFWNRQQPNPKKATNTTKIKLSVTKTTKGAVRK